MDNIIATHLDTTMKACAGGLARTATETANPELRQVFAQASQTAIQNQQQLFELMDKKGWYRPPAARSEDIQQVLQQLEMLTQQPTTTPV